MAPEKLKLGISDKPQWRALLNGRVKIPDVEIEFVTQFKGRSVVERHRQFNTGELDLAEFCLSTVILMRSLNMPFYAFPIFLSRAFRQGHLFYSEASSARTPRELKGKKIALHNYHATTMVWVKGLLSSEWGVPPEAVEWHTAATGTLRQFQPKRPITIKLIPEPRDISHLWDLLVRGEVQAGIAPSDISSDTIKPFFPDARAMEKEYYERTGIFPIIHVLCASEKACNAGSGLGEKLAQAFRAAYELREEYMTAVEKKQFDETVAALGGKIPTFVGLPEEARRVLDALMEFQIEQGILEKKVELNSIFAPGSI